MVTLKGDRAAQRKRNRLAKHLREMRTYHQKVVEPKTNYKRVPDYTFKKALEKGDENDLG